MHIKTITMYLPLDATLDDEDPYRTKEDAYQQAAVWLVLDRYGGAKLDRTETWVLVDRLARWLQWFDERE